MLDFALFGDAGAGRNVLNLLTSGRNVVTLDDDVLALPWECGEASSALRFAGHEFCEEVGNFESRSDALDNLRAADIFLLDAHNRLLGRSLGELCDEYGPRVDLRNACEHTLAWLQAGADPTVRMSFSGLAGDSGAQCPYPLLFHSPSLRRRAAFDPSVAAVALSGREVRRIVDAVTITHNSHCMTYCTGLSNLQPLPPFMPIGRNQDGVFGQTLKYCEPESISAHVPVGIVHDSLRPSQYQPGEVPFVRPRLCDFLARPILDGRARTSLNNRDDRMRHLGRTLSGIGTLPPKDFGEFVLHAALNHRCADSVRFDGVNGEDSATLTAVGRQYQDALVRTAQTPDFFFPREFDAIRSMEEREQRLRTYMVEYGRLLTAWPDIAYSAIDLSEEMGTDGMAALPGCPV